MGRELKDELKSSRMMTLPSLKITVELKIKGIE